LSLLLPLLDLSAPHAFVRIRTVSVVLALRPYGTRKAHQLTFVKLLSLLGEPRISQGCEGVDVGIGGAGGGTGGGEPTTGGVLLPGLVAEEELCEELSSCGVVVVGIGGAASLGSLPFPFAATAASNFSVGVNSSVWAGFSCTVGEVGEIGVPVDTTSDESADPRADSAFGTGVIASSASTKSSTR
jgi:hypothetical protein